MIGLLDGIGQGLGFRGLLGGCLRQPEFANSVVSCLKGTVSNMFHPDFLEFFTLLTEHQVEWMLVGGYAYQLHVEARVTQDLDVWVKLSRENLERLSLVVQAFVGQGLDVEAALGLLETKYVVSAVGANTLPTTS